MRSGPSFLSQSEGESDRLEAGWYAQRVEWMGGEGRRIEKQAQYGGERYP